MAEAYEKYKEEYGDNLTYAEFLKEYLSGSSDGNAAVIGQCLLSSMKVYAEFRYSYTERYGWQTVTVKDVGYNMGSAVVYQMDENYAYVVTNYHVVYYNNANADNGSYIANKIHCYLYGSESAPVDTGLKDDQGYRIYDYGEYGIDCEYIGGSVEADIAVLRAKTSDIRAINGDAHAVTLSDGYCVGQTAIAVGNAEGEGISVTEGIVSVDNESILLSIDGTTRSYRSLRIDTAIYSGNSGGGLFDGDGELIGITNAGDNTDQNINYAIPIEIVRGVAENIIDHFEDGDPTTNGVYKPKLGITVLSENVRYVYDYSLGYGTVREDVVIDEITSASVAEKIGLAAGDTVTALNINGKAHAIDRSFDISDSLYTLRAGDKLTVSYLRDGVENTSGEYTFESSDFSLQK